MQLWNKEIEAVIFDMDGTMFDTERLRFQMLKKASKELFDIEMADELLYDSLGVSAVTGEELAKNMYGKDFPYKEVRALADSYERQYIIENGVPIKNGLYNLLERVKKNHLFVALATSSKRSIAKEYLSIAKVSRYFDVLICGDDVVNGKPKPDIFLKAANELSCDPDKCIVFEDSQNGIIAALQAGANPVFIKDIKDISADLKNQVICAYDDMTSMLYDLIEMSPKLPMPTLSDSFPIVKDYETVGIHGFGAIGGGYLAQIFSHWDGYTRPSKMIGATQNTMLIQMVNSCGKYGISYESLAYFQQINDITLIDITDEDAVIKMYEQSCVVGLSLPEKAIPEQSKLIAKALRNRYEKGLDKLTILIVLNKTNAAKYVMKHIKNELKKILTDGEVNAVLRSAYFCESVVNRMVSAIPLETVIQKMQQDIIDLHRNIVDYSADVMDLFSLSGLYLQETKPKKIKHKMISISKNFASVSKFANAITSININLFSSEADMPIFVSKESPILNRLIQVSPVESIAFLQEIKNKLSNGTHAIIAWYAMLLGYDTIGRGMGDERIVKLATEIMKQEIRPALIAENKEYKKYINTFIDNFIERCRYSFKDKCTRVGRDPLRKLQRGERVLGAIDLAEKHNLSTDKLEFGVACAILYSLKNFDLKDLEAAKIREIYHQRGSIADVLTYDGPYNKSIYQGMDREADRKRIEKIESQFYYLQSSIEAQEQ
jgi:HAD superfamily hydrolase (TIGR01509 family)